MTWLNTIVIAAGVSWVLALALVICGMAALHELGRRKVSDVQGCQILLTGISVFMMVAMAFGYWMAT